jgi:uncharacterized protein YcnI
MERMLRIVVMSAIVGAALSAAQAALGHAGMSPPVVVDGKAQLFSLTVPTEEEGLKTTQVELTVPDGFRVFSFQPAPGWKRTQVTQGSGEETTVKSVKWTGGAVPLGEVAVFQFVGLPDSAGDLRFRVRQTYSDGSIVNWSGPDGSERSAAVVEAKSSLGGGGSSTLSVVGLVLAALALLVALGGLAAGARRGGRPLA